MKNAKSEESYKVQNIIAEILEETEHTRETVNINTVKRYLRQGLSEEDVFALYYISSSYRNVFVGTGDKKPKFIPIGTVKKFADQFFPDDYDVESLDDSIPYLIGLLNGQKVGELGYRISTCSHITCVMQRATAIAEEYGVFSIEEFTSLLNDPDLKWEICIELEIPQRPTKTTHFREGFCEVEAL